MIGRWPLCVQFVIVLALACASSGVSAAQEEGVELTVAVFNFETKGQNVADLGEKVGDLLTAFLSAEEGLQLVDRTQIKKILQEMELGASGIVAEDQAARIGGMLGAQVLITGRAFTVNEKLFLTAKAISVETSRVNAQVVKGDLDGELDVIVQELSTKTAQWLRDNSQKMIASIQTPLDVVAALRKALAKKELPTLAVTVIERHAGTAVADPAAETEVIYLLRKAGVPVLDAKQARLSDWAREYLKDAQIQPPSSADKCDVIIVGEGLSEFAGRQENLISVKARVEMRAIDRRTSRVLAISRKTATQVDLAELVAAKTALQKAAGEAAAEMMPQAVEEWNKLHKPEKGAEE